MSKKITKAVFPVGGLGTRFLPATKSIPKEMLPVVDKPLIQYAVEEAVAAGIDTLIFITGRNKQAIANHFDKAYELEHELELKQKEERLRTIREIIPAHVDCIYIRQSEALGLGHAVHCAKKVVGNEPFAVLLADDLIDGNSQPCLAQMVEAFEERGNSVIAVEEVDHDKTDQYGIVEVDDAASKCTAIQAIVEKPKPADAPSNLAVVGRYILTPRILQLLETTGKDAGGEIQLTDAISALLSEQPVNAFKFNGVRHDCGSKAGFLRANIEFALQHADLEEQLKESSDKICEALDHQKD
ncbi:MAG: UTP--glucose-1-phosphate uridylyltransferase [Cycloclasticus sp. symbiont of Poecilosclerida sp. M]|nr:MAG: UTP--glucose-1-phosphate uridylyltransferase [Cycloclasticus sp. symbiont of Poecilosclerida sp. M]